MNKLLDLIKQTFRKATIRRVLFNWEIYKRRGLIKGKTLDLACGKNPSYYQYLEKNDVQLTRADIKADSRSVAVDLNKSLPFANNSYDTALLLNVIYILDKPEVAVSECYRVLKPKGFLILSSPFIFNEAPEPHDYYRFTAEKLRLFLSAAGFQKIEIAPIGERFTAAAYLLAPFLYFRLAKIIFYSTAITLDKLIPKGLKKRYPCPLSYLCVAQK